MPAVFAGTGTLPEAGGGLCGEGQGAFQYQGSAGAPEGAGEDSRWSQGYVTVRMVLGTSDSDVDKIMTNRSY